MERMWFDDGGENRLESGEISGGFPSERVYILFAAGDARFCLALAARLRSLGVMVAHERYANEQMSVQVVNLEQEFRLATTYIVLVSRAALASPRLRNELRRAYEAQREAPRRRILPVVIEPLPRDAVLSLLADESLSGEPTASARVANTIVDAQSGSLEPVLAALGIGAGGPAAPVSPLSPASAVSPLPPRSYPSLLDPPAPPARQTPPSALLSPRRSEANRTIAASGASTRKTTPTAPTSAWRRPGVIIAVVTLTTLLLVSVGLAVTHNIPGLGSNAPNSAGATATAATNKPAASPTPRPPVGVLHLQVAPAPGQVNLTAQGNADWAHWGVTSNGEVSGLDHKSGGGLISPYTAAGTATPTTCAPSFTWSDGTPLASSSTNSCVAVSGAHNSLTFTVLADTTTRVLHVYMSANSATGLFFATLSDDSALLTPDTSLNTTSGEKDEVFTLTYQAASAGQTLTVSLTLQSGSGSIALQAATLATVS